MRQGFYLTVSVSLFISVFQLCCALGQSDPEETSRCADRLPIEAKRLLEMSYGDWSILEFDHLYPHQQELLDTTCPGVESGRFDGSDEYSYAVVVVRQIEQIKQAKLLLLERAEESYVIRVLREEDKVFIYPIVHRGPPGTYQYFYDPEIKVDTRYEVIVYEKLEATATVFYYQDDTYKQLLISD